MGRPARPWYWRARDGWYATIDGQRRLLAEGKAAKAEATRRFHELMAAAGRQPRQGTVPTVAELYAEFGAALGRRIAGGELEPTTRRDVRRRLGDFHRRFGGVRADTIRPNDVLTWVDERRYTPKHQLTARTPKRGRPGRPKLSEPKPEPVPPPPPPESRPLGPTARHDCVAAVKAMFAWGKSAGLLATNPLEGMALPRRAKRRELVIDAGQWPAILEAIRSPRFRDLAEFLHGTGARPGEAFRLEARHVDPDGTSATLSDREHKTGRKTGADRTIYFSPRAAAIVARLRLEHPAGPLFRNARDKAWNRDSVNCQVRGIRARAGVGREFVAYALRHLFATDALDRGVGVETVANMLGHADSSMVSQVYSRLNERRDHFRDAIRKVRGDGPAGGDQSPQA